MSSLSPHAVKKFRSALLTWYASAARDLPWRKTRDPYTVIVSELMLQQTQVDRVIPKYRAWMKKFPNVQTLASASTREVLGEWQGLGYNRRAQFLHRMAKEVTKTYGGIFPNSIDALMSLPGIGPYTARAVMNFAFETSEPIVETNVRRVLSRIFVSFKHTLSLTEKEYWALAHAATPKKDHYNFNQAIMDFGAVVCVAKKPKCEACPFQNMCNSYPEILSAQPKHLRVTKKTNEKIYFGEPRRIWRGKILKFLHTPRQQKNGASLVEIGNAIQNDFSVERKEWLKSVLHTLIADKMVEQKGKRYHLPL
ncbi:MAG: A/G-specific adenine glycosylase [Candidatus Kerfeldbacteria bacterium]|nr:A/G-specific adenine glycosylase [Candidatus Kerfeldbacteria bacterium]